MKYIHELGTNLSTAFKRFPISLIWAILGSLFCIVVLEFDAVELFETYQNEVLILILGVSWLLATGFFIEALAPKKLWWIQLPVLLLLGLFYWTLPEHSIENTPIVITRWFLYLFAGHVFLFFAPFVNHWNTSSFWNYLKNIFIAIGRSALFSLILFLGLILALAAVDALFELDLAEKRYGQIFVLCFGIVNTCIYVADFPKNIQQNRDVIYNKALEVFIKFILIPLVLLYLIILYLYSFKILILWELPQGWVSYMITTLALLGFIIQIIINPVRKTQPVFLIRKFYPWFYLLLLPLMGLLFVAVFRRIADYNFTESRYFLLALSIWIFCMILYLLLSKKKQLRVLPISLFILIILSSFGPWGAFQVSIRAQTQEFRRVFSEINLETKTISQENADRLQSITRYLENRNKLYMIEPIIGFNPEVAFENYDGYQWNKKILDSLHIKTVEMDGNENGRRYYQNDNPVLTEIGDFTYFIALDLTPYPNEAVFVLTQEENKLTIKKGDQVLLSFNIDQEVLDMVNEYGNLDQVPDEDFIFHFTNKIGDFKIVVGSISFFIEDDAVTITNMEVYLFSNYLE